MSRERKLWSRIRFDKKHDGLRTYSKRATKKLTRKTLSGDAERMKLRIGACSSQGLQAATVDRQDDFMVEISPDGLYCLLGVYDGYGGPEVARYLAHNMVAELKSNENFEDGVIQTQHKRQNNMLGSAMLEVHMKIDDDLASPEGLAKLRALTESRQTKLEGAAQAGRLLQSSQRSLKSGQFSRSHSAPDLTVQDEQRPFPSCQTSCPPRPPAIPVPDKFMCKELTRTGAEQGRPGNRSAVPNRVQRWNFDAWSPLRCTSHFPSAEDRDDWLKTVGDDEVGFASGSTALTVLITERMVMIASVGNSRAGMIRHGTPGIEILNEDHTLRRPEEERRVRAAGGQDMTNHCVEGELPCSRMLGCHKFKRSSSSNPLQQKVIARPEIVIVERSEKDLFLVLGTDGLWDFLFQNDHLEIEKKVLCSKKKEEIGVEDLGVVSLFLSETAVLHYPDSATNVIVDFTANHPTFLPKETCLIL